MYIESGLYYITPEPVLHQKSILERVAIMCRLPAGFVGLLVPGSTLMILVCGWGAVSTQYGHTAPPEAQWVPPYLGPIMVCQSASCKLTPRVFLKKGTLSLRGKKPVLACHCSWRISQASCHIIHFIAHVVCNGKWYLCKTTFYQWATYNASMCLCSNESTKSYFKSRGICGCPP